MSDSFLRRSDGVRQTDERNWNAIRSIRMGGATHRTNAQRNRAAWTRSESKRNSMRPSPAFSARLANQRGIRLMRGNSGKMYRISVGSNGVARWVLA